MTFDFFLPCEALPKQGDRSAVIQRPGRKSFVTHYAAPKVAENAAWLQTLCKKHRPLSPMEGPLSLYLRFQFPYRKTDANKLLRGKDICPWKHTKPDCDNLGKQLCDVLEKCGFFGNDAQIADLRVQKVWAPSPGVHVVLGSLIEVPDAKE